MLIVYMKYFKIISVMFLNTIIMNVLAQDINKTKIDEKSQTEMLIGLCNRDGLKSDVFKTYYNSEYTVYIPDTLTVTNLKTTFAGDDIKITIVMGSWCGDSQEQVPRFYKVIDALEFSEKNILLYCVDRSKKSEKNETDILKIQLVPTIIFYKDDNEIGRIIESPKNSLEKDMLQIFS